MIRVFKMKFPAFSGREKRRAYVYLPDGYFLSGKRYPVLYMFDGHNVFFDSHATYGKSWGMGEYLKKTRAELIIAAFECNHGEHGERILEYSPWDFDIPEGWGGENGPKGHAPGYGDDTMKWFTSEFKPYIDSRFRTLPERESTYIMGSSMGGLMSIYALGRYNRVFSKACALSPSMGPWMENIEKMLKTQNIDPKTEIYLDYGMREKEADESAAMLARVGKMFADRGAAVTLRLVPDGTHCEASWEKQLPLCMNMLMYK